MSHRYAQVLVVFVVLVAVTLACASGIGGPTSTPTTDPATPAAATAKVEAQLVLDRQATADIKATSEAEAEAEAAQATEAVQATLDAQATEEANATATLVAKQLVTKEAADARATEKVAATSTAKAEAIIEATAQAQSMLDEIQPYIEDGYVSTLEGDYYTLEDFHETWAQLRWYQYWWTGYDPDNFVLQAHFAWLSASDKADWWASGCGFVFHEQDVDNHYLVYLALDGNAYFSRFRNGNYARIGSGYYGSLDYMDGSADIALIVENGWVTFLVNGKKVFRLQDTTIPGGNLAYTLNSGTNKDYGTSCTMTEVELLELK
ncbi:MAG: hypothetical protein EHM70_20370 [Chloroflexota bacterium]|nr:MAG: hypothetical protein EHM70_20370 [Chloroflexota bacterium]